MLSALCHWFKCDPSQQRQAFGEACCPVFTWEMWRTMYYKLTEIICMIWLGTHLLIWHLYKGFLQQKKRPFTFASLQAVPAQSPEDKDNFPVFWLVTNDPPDLCRGNVTSSCYNSNLQLIGNCIIACITRRVFTFNFFLLSLWIYSLCLYLCFYLSVLASYRKR